MYPATHKLIIHIGVNLNHEYHCGSVEEAFRLFDVLREQMDTPPWGWAVMPIKELVN